MHMDIAGSEEIEASQQQLWEGLNDPEVLTRCIPGCRKMTETAPDTYDVELELKVAAVGGSFNGAVALSDKTPPAHCRITVSGEGTLGDRHRHGGIHHRRDRPRHLPAGLCGRRPRSGAWWPVSASASSNPSPST